MQITPENVSISQESSEQNKFNFNWQWYLLKNTLNTQSLMGDENYTPFGPTILLSLDLGQLFHFIPSYI